MDLDAMWAGKIVNIEQDTLGVKKLRFIQSMNHALRINSSE
jgi:hypothetical protein